MKTIPTASDAKAAKATIEKRGSIYGAACVLSISRTVLLAIAGRQAVNMTSLRGFRVAVAELAAAASGGGTE